MSWRKDYFNKLELCKKKYLDDDDPPDFLAFQYTLLMAKRVKFQVKDHFIICGVDQHKKTAYIYTLSLDYNKRDTLRDFLDQFTTHLAITCIEYIVTDIDLETFDKVRLLMKKFNDRTRAFFVRKIEDPMEAKFSLRFLYEFIIFYHEKIPTGNLVEIPFEASIHEATI